MRGRQPRDPPRLRDPLQEDSYVPDERSYPQGTTLRTREANATQGTRFQKETRDQFDRNAKGEGPDERREGDTRMWSPSRLPKPLHTTARIGERTIANRGGSLFRGGHGIRERAERRWRPPSDVTPPHEVGNTYQRPLPYNQGWQSHDSPCLTTKGGALPDDQGCPRDTNLRIPPCRSTSRNLFLFSA